MMHLLQSSNRVALSFCNRPRYRGLPKNAAQLFTLFGLANLMLARRHVLACDAQGAS